MMNEYEVVVIGTGFGGAVTAYKLAKKGYKVCILERGTQWTGEYFPGSNKQSLAENLQGVLLSSRLSKFGIPFRDILKRGDFLNLIEKLERPALWEYRVLDKMDVLTANGVGGGSLIYANVLHRAHKEAFEKWPNSVNWPVELEKHYSEVEIKIGTNVAMCNKSRALKMASEKSGKGRWALVDLAIQRLHPQMSTIDINKECELEDEKGFCLACGRCVIGCKRLNKRTLDLNYIRDAVRYYEAHLYTNYEVTKIKPLKDAFPFNYLVFCDEQQRVFKAQKVVVAAGSLGSAKLLLRCKKDPESLPNLSSRLGERFSGNGDFQGFAYNCNVPVNSSTGPTITSGVDFNPSKPILVEDGGMPDILSPLAQIIVPSLGELTYLKEFTLKDFVDLMLGKKELKFNEDVSRNSLTYLCMGRVEAYGKIGLSEAGDVSINWDESEWNRLKEFTEDLVKELIGLTKGIGGTYFSNPLWDMGKLVTVHPLGGCPMAERQEEGVVKPNGEVFGYDDLYVSDGSIIPASLGVNPSLTIAALASRIAELIPGKI